MTKTAAEFLSELAQRDLAPANVVASLRRQVGEATKPVSALAIARLLVEKGHLTAVQAERLLGAPLTAAKHPSPAALAETKPMDAELGLAPLADAPAPAKATRPAEATTALEPLDLGLLDLVPLDEPQKPVAAKTPAAARPPAKASAGAAGLSPLTPLEPIPSPLTPIPQPAMPSSRKKPARPAAASSALEELPRPAAPLSPAIPAAAAARPAGSSRLLWWIGGAVVGMMLLGGLAGGIVLLMLPRGDVASPFDLAEQDYKTGQYAAAAEKYTSFLQDEPAHPQASLARVRRGMARMLSAKGTENNWPAVLPAAQEALAEIDREPALSEAHAELAPLLTDMTAGLLARAEETSSADAAARLAEVRSALALTDNGRYVPGVLRDWQRLAGIAESLAVLQRRQQVRQALEQFTSSAKKHLAAGAFAKFVADRDKLLGQYAELAGDPQLNDLGAEAAKFAADAAQPLTELPQAQTSDREAPVVAVLPPSVTARGPEGTIVARAGEWIWALDAAAGHVLWRRNVGGHIGPLPLAADESQVLLADESANEVICVDRRTGALRWRVALGASIAGPPLAAAGRIYVTTSAGQIIALDQKTGEAVAGCRLPLPASAGAMADSSGKLLYQSAAADFLFVLSADDLKGQSAVFIGHTPHSIQVPPLVLPGRLIVAECRGLDRTVLHVLMLDDAGSPRGKHDRLELPGHVLTPPVVFGDRLLVLTDSGTIFRFGIPAAGDAPLAKLGETPANSGRLQLSFGLIVGSRLCRADEGLALFDLAATGEGLQCKWLRWEGDSFSSPPQQIGETIFCVRHSPGRGHVAAAVKAADGQPLWETTLAVPAQEAVP